MGKNKEFLHTKSISEVGNFPGVDIPSDRVRAYIIGQRDGETLSVGLDPEGNNFKLKGIGTTEFGEADWTEILQHLEEIYGALASQKNDKIRVETPDPIDVSSIQIENSSGTVIDPATKTLEDILNALKSNGSDELVSRIVNPSGTEIDPTNIQSVAGTSLTGADWTPLFQNLDIALSVLRDSFNDDGYWNGASLAADGSLTKSLSAVNGEVIKGQVKSSGGYDVEVIWKDGSGNTIRTESIASGISAGTWTDIDLNLKSKYADVKISDTSSSSQTVDGTLSVS